MGIHEKIRELREMKGWSQEEFSEKIGMSANGYGDLERGKRSFDWDKIQKIADVFEIDILQLIEADKKGLPVQQVIGFNVENNKINYMIDQEQIIELEKLKVQVEYLQKIIEKQEQQIETLNAFILELKNKV